MKSDVLTHESFWSNLGLVAKALLDGDKLPALALQSEPALLGLLPRVSHGVLEHVPPDTRNLSVATLERTLLSIPVQLLQKRPAGAENQVLGRETGVGDGGQDARE